MIRFDTRDKKPTLYDLLPLTAVTLALFLLLLRLDGQRYAGAICALLGLYYLTVILRLLFALRGQIRYNPYSYNTIIYTGFALFLLSVLITHVLVSVRILRWPELYTLSALLHMILGSAKTYMLLSSPFILLFSVALCVSNISLIRHEGRRLVNVLGIILSFLLVGGEVFLFLFNYYVSGSQREVMIHDLIANLFAAVYLYFECMLIGAIAAHVIVYRYDPDPDKDYINILGCGIRKDGSPTPLLRGRMDRALAFAEKQAALTGKAPVFVVSGGQGPDEAIPESACMKRYLLERGVPEERIVEEDRSTDTAENMRFSKEKILERGEPGKIAYATTNYHVFRAGLCARRVKMRAVGMGADTKWYFWPNAAVREFVGLLTAHRLKQGLIFGGLTVFYVALTLLAYR